MKRQMELFVIMICAVLLAFISTLVANAHLKDLAEVKTGYRLDDYETARGLRDELNKWDDFYVKERQRPDKAVGMALTPGLDMHANTSTEQLRYFNHRLHCLAWSVTNQQLAVQFTNLVERYLTNLPKGPE